MIELLIKVGLTVLLLIVGFLFGRRAEKRHYRSIMEREKHFARVLAFSERLPPVLRPAPKSAFVSGSVVISVDYFKRFVAGMRNLVGGRVTSYESLLDRARREAILRMKAEAKALGADQIFNVKLETASINKGAADTVAAVEVFAYGTALIPQRPREAAVRQGR